MLDRRKELYKGILSKFRSFFPTLQKCSTSFEIFLNYKFRKIPAKYSRIFHALRRTDETKVIRRCRKRGRATILICVNK